MRLSLGFRTQYLGDVIGGSRDGYFGFGSLGTIGGLRVRISREGLSVSRNSSSLSPVDDREANAATETSLAEVSSGRGPRRTGEVPSYLLGKYSLYRGVGNGDATSNFILVLTSMTLDRAFLATMRCGISASCWKGADPRRRFEGWL